MATGTVYVDASIKDQERDASLVVGRLLVGNNSTVRPQDLNLRTIRSMVLTPWGAGPARFIPGSGQLRSAIIMSGSIGSLGVLDTSTAAATPVGNYVRIRAHRLYGTGQGANSTGTWRLGTQAGSMRASFIAVGH